MGKNYTDTRATSRKVKTIALLIKWDWSKSVTKYGIKVQVIQQVRTADLPVQLIPANQAINRKTIRACTFHFLYAIARCLRFKDFNGFWEKNVPCSKLNHFPGVSVFENDFSPPDMCQTYFLFVLTLCVYEVGMALFKKELKFKNWKDTERKAVKDRTGLRHIVPFWPQAPPTGYAALSNIAFNLLSCDWTTTRLP